MRDFSLRGLSCYNTAMKAIHMTAPGPAAEVLALVDVPEPEITGPTQIKVALRAAGVNPVDTKLRSRGVFYPGALPAILGCDGAGIVTATGSDVKRYQPGDAVWFCHGGLGGAPGNYAEYAVLDESEAEPKPPSLEFTEAAALPLVLITAWEALYDRAGLAPGQTVLVHAGAGGVGHVAIQLARAGGARVATTVSTPEKAEFARRLGADHPIPYRERDFVEAVMEWTQGRGVDVVLDSLGGDTFRHSLDAACVYGQVVTLLDPGRDVDWGPARERNLRIGFTLMLTPMLQDLPQARAHQGEILNRCTTLIEDGKLKPQVSAVLPLAEAAKAHQAIEAGHVQGKIVLDIR
jgi:NADPH2:quinone reductase